MEKTGIKEEVADELPSCSPELERPPPEHMENPAHKPDNSEDYERIIDVDTHVTLAVLESTVTESRISCASERKPLDSIQLPTTSGTTSTTPETLSTTPETKTSTQQPTTSRMGMPSESLAGRPCRSQKSSGAPRIRARKGKHSAASVFSMNKLQLRQLEVERQRLAVEKLKLETLKEVASKVDSLAEGMMVIRAAIRYHFGIDFGNSGAAKKAEDARAKLLTNSLGALGAIIDSSDSDADEDAEDVGAKLLTSAMDAFEAFFDDDDSD